MSRTQIAAASVGVGLAVLLLKALAYWVTGSAAFYSDALESIVNVIASGIAFGALRFAAMPADSNHPYGHDKAESFAAIIEGGLIVVAAMLIVFAAWAAWQHPRPIRAPWNGIALSGLATVGNAGWGATLIRAARRFRSPALAGDGRHLLADVATSLGAITGITVASLTGFERLDPILAALIAVHVLLQGLVVVRRSVGGLMDELPDQSTLDRVRALVGGNADGAIEAHDIRLRQSGRLTFVEFHLVVPGRMSVDDAHDICDRVEGALRSTMEDLVVTIHVEPERKAKHTGVVVL